jgi:hypothetical protein
VPSASETLADALEDLSALLRRYGEVGWASKIDDDLFFVRKADPYGAKRFQTYFGGMGSLNDLVLCRANGHPVAPSEEAELNARLETMLSGAYRLAGEFGGTLV